MDKINNWKKKEPFLIIILCLAIILVAVAALAKADKLQMIFDPDSLVADQKKQEEEFDPVGYGLKENDESSDGKDNSETNQGDSLEQQNDNQLRKLDSLAPEGGYRGTKTTNETKENEKVYVDEKNNQGEQIAGTDPAPGGQVPSDQYPEESTERENNSGNEDQTPGSEEDNNDDNSQKEDGADDGGNESSGSQTKWILDGISVSYYRNKDAVLLYKEQLPSEEYIKGNLTVISYWHEKGESSNEKTVTEKDFSLNAIPEEFAHKLTAQDVGKSFTLNLECQGVKKQILCKIENDTIHYMSMKVRYKSTPTYVAGEPLTKTNIQDAIQLDVYGKTTLGKQDVYLSDEKNYEIIFDDKTNGVASKNPDSATGEWTAGIQYYGMNEGTTVVLSSQKDAVTYQVKKYKLTVMYDDNTVLDVIYTDDKTIVLNKEYNGISPYNKMIQMLQANGRYGVNADGYLTNLFYGWSPYPTMLEGENISYEFKDGQHEQTMYAISLELVKEGYLVRQDGNDQVLVGYLGGGSDNGILKVPYGITRIKMDQNFQVSDQASSVRKIVLSETVNSVDLTNAGEKFTGLESYQVAENNYIFNNDEDGLLYSEDGTILWKVPANIKEFSVKSSVTKIAGGALKGVAASTVSGQSVVKITLSSENPPVLETSSDGKVFGGINLEIAIIVNDTEDDSKIKDLIYKRYVSSWGQLLDREMERAGAAAEIIRTPKGVESGYENNGGNVYSRENGQKILEFIPEDTGTYYEVEADVFGIGSYAFMEAEKVQFIKISDNVKMFKNASLESKTENQLQGVEIESSDKITLETKMIGKSPKSGFHIYLSAKQNDLSGWMNQLTDDYGQEKAEEILVYAEGNLWIDDQGCVYLLEDERNGLLTLCSVPVNLKTFVEPDGYHITKIADGAFAWCDKLVYLELPDVSVVEKNAFKGCSNLEILVLTDKKLEFPNQAFDGCGSLETLLVYNRDLTPELPNQAELLQDEKYFAERTVIYETIGENQYQVVNIPTSIKGNILLKEGTTKIGDCACSGCNLITGFYEEQWQEIDQIGDYAFYGCTQFGEESEQLAYEDGRTEMTPGILSVDASVIGSFAFQNCSGITKLILGENCHQLGESAFRGCDSLETIQWMGDTRTVGDTVFAECKKLEWVYFGDGTGQTITTAGNRTFENCTELKMVYLWASLKEIGESCFRGCTGTRVSVGEDAASGLQKIGAYAFADCTNLAMNLTYFTELTTLEEGAFLNCSYIQSTTIPEKVRNIPDYCFAGCSGLKQFVVISTSRINSIGKGAFSGCTKLEKMMNLETLTNLTKIGESAFSSCKIGNQSYQACTALTDVQLSESIVEIDKAAFSGCTALWQFNGAKATSLDNLGESALKDCASLTDVSLSETKITTLSPNLFYGCKALESLTLPKTLETIQGGSLSYCTKLAQMIIKNADKMVTIDYRAMWESWKNQTLRIYVPATENHVLLNQYRSSWDWGFVLFGKQDEVIQEMTLRDDTFIENGGIYNPLEDGTYRLEKVISTSKGIFAMKDNTSEMAADAFSGCDNMTILVLANTLKSVPDEALADCSALEALVLDRGASPEFKGNLFGDGEANDNFAIWKDDTATVDSRYPVKNYGTDRYVYDGMLYGIYVENGTAKISLQYIPRSYKGELSILYGTRMVADHAGEGCGELTVLNSAMSVEKIGDYAFANCTSLQKVDLTSTTNTCLKEVGDYAFYGCTSLNGKNTSTSSSETQLLLPFSLEKYGKGMLKDCKALTSVFLSGAVSELPDEFCSGCENLKTISMSSTILKGIKRIGKETFYNCKQITSISWSNMPILKVVDDRAYKGCSSLMQATFADQIETFGDECFAGTNLEMISFNGSNPPALGDDIMEKKIQEQVSIFVPAGEDGATYLKFYQAWEQKYPLLASSLISQDGSGFRAVSNVLYLVNPQNSKELTAMKVPTNLSSVSIYNSASLWCIGLGKESFKGCSKITNLVIPNRVTFIGEKTFENCTSLKQISMQGNVMKTIGNEAFRNCQSLENLILPTSVESLGNGMLKECSGFKTLYLNSFTPCRLGSKIFGDTLNEDVRIIVPLGSYEDYIRLWGDQLNKEYGTEDGEDIGKKLIIGLSETEKIEDGITYQYINGHWVEKTVNKSTGAMEDTESNSEEKMTETGSSDSSATEKISDTEEASEESSEKISEKSTEETSQEEKTTERKESEDISKDNLPEENTGTTESTESFQEQTTGVDKPTDASKEDE